MSVDPHLVERLHLTQEVLALGPNAFERTLGLNFRPFDTDTYFGAWQRLAEHARTGRLCKETALYVHLPFCGKVCSYCLLSTARTPGRNLIDRYLNAVDAELARYAPIVEHLKITSVHIGGGTPTLLSVSQLESLFKSLNRVVDLRACPVGIEASPGTFTEDKARLLVAHDVDRVSFGVETFTPEVLKAVRRSGQKTEVVIAAVATARRVGIREVNIDLLAGLPEETVDSFASSVEQALALDIDSMSVNRYIAENAPLSAAGHVPGADERARCDRMLMTSDDIIRTKRPATRPVEPLEKAGYGTQYVWDSRAGARNYFQQDMIGPGSTLTIGHGAMGHLHGGGFYTTACSLNEYVEALEAGDLPDILLSPVSMRFEMAHYFADRACRGTFRESDFVGMFNRHIGEIFGPELDFLIWEGLLRKHGENWRKPENLTFQIHHLVSFLVRSHAELTQLQARSLEQHPLRRTRSELLFFGDKGAVPSRDLTQSARSAVFVDHLGETERDWLNQNSVGEVIRPVASVIAQPEWLGIGSETTRSLYAYATSDEEFEHILKVAQASEVERVLLNTDSHCSSGEARAILERANKSPLAVELIPMAAPADVYSALDVDLSASVLWCRITMEACRAGRRSSKAELRI